MSDPSKDLDLGALWPQTGVKINLPIRTGHNKKKAPKKKDSSSSEAKTEQAKKAPEAQQSGDGSQMVTPPSQLTTAIANPPQTSNAAPDVEARAKRQREEAVSSDANLKRGKAEIQERLAEKGKLPSIADLEACRRVGEHGLELFNELAELMAGELTKRLEGKISSLDVDNRRLEGKLFQVQKELSAFRDDSLVSFSEDNRALKEELELLRQAKEALDKANIEATELKKKVQRLPDAEREIEEAKIQAQEAAKREEELKEQVRNLQVVEGKLTERLSEASAAGFQRCLEIVAVVAPETEFDYLDGTYEAKGGKLYKEGQLAYDPDAEEAGEEKSPATAEGEPGVEGNVAATELEGAA